MSVTDATWIPGEHWDPLHTDSGPELHWTTTNIGEGLPGVPTPLSWSLWSVVEASARSAAFAIGALTREERTAPRMEERFIRIFYGRPAVQLEYLTLLGDRMPGTSGEAAAGAVFGRVPDDVVYHPTKRRYPVVAWRLPHVFATAPRRLRIAAAQTDRWYPRELAGIAGQDREAAIETFRRAQAHFAEMIVIQGWILYGVVQPLYEALSQLVAQTETGDVGTLSGSGGAEMLGLVGDIWKASRGELTPEELIARHGCHGPREGELSARVWREDPEPLRRLIGEYRARPDSEEPAARERARAEQRAQMERALLARIPAHQRASARLVLSLAAKRIPLRGVAKRSFLQAFDVARASARQAGEWLAADGWLEHADDVFYLTAEELTGRLPGDVKELVALRRQRRSEYEQLRLPSEWKGLPVPESLNASGEGLGTSLGGIGVSSGVAEGIARIVLDPAFAEVEPDEILVAPFTDPSWSSVMFISRALVVDIGGALSHAAVVARELGIPCVVNTRNGSRVIRDGDRIRVDGDAGTVEVLEHAALEAAR